MPDEPTPATPPISLPSAGELFHDARTQYGIGSGLTRKKFTAFFWTAVPTVTAGGAALTAGYSVAASWLFGFACALAAIYMASEAYVDREKARWVGEVAVRKEERATNGGT